MTQKPLQDWFENDYWPVVFPKQTKKQAAEFIKKLDPDTETREKIVNYYVNYPESTPEKFIPRPQDPIRVLRNERYLDEIKDSPKKQKVYPFDSSKAQTWPDYSENPLNQAISDAFHPIMSHWFTSLKIVESKDSITLKAHTDFNRDWIKDHYLDDIKKVFDKKVVLL